MKSSARTVLAMAVTLVMLHAHAATRVDDAGTVVSPPVSSLQWASPGPGSSPGSPAAAEFSVALRLNLSAYTGKPLRVWMAMRTLGPVPANVTARWAGRGPILGGTLREGSRALVFDGVPARPFLEESVPFRVEADGSRVDRIQQIRFEFEAEPR